MVNSTPTLPESGETTLDMGAYILGVNHPLIAVVRDRPDEDGGNEPGFRTGAHEYDTINPLRTAVPFWGLFT